MALRQKAAVTNYAKFGAGQSIDLLKFISKFSFFDLSFGASDSLTISVNAMKNLILN